MDAVSTTVEAGSELVRRGESLPVASHTQTGKIRAGKRTEGRVPKIKDYVPLAELDDIVYGR
jgi:myo-inositol-1-phosphate synthase